MIVTLIPGGADAIVFSVQSRFCDNYPPKCVGIKLNQNQNQYVARYHKQMLCFGLLQMGCPVRERLSVLEILPFPR